MNAIKAAGESSFEDRDIGNGVLHGKNIYSLVKIDRGLGGLSPP